MQFKWFTTVTCLAVLLVPMLTSNSYGQFGFGGGFRGNPIRGLRQGLPLAPPIPPVMPFRPTPFARGGVIVGPPGLPPIFPRSRRSAIITVQPSVQPRVNPIPRTTAPTYNQQPTEVYRQPAAEVIPTGPTLAPTLPEPTAGGGQSVDLQEVQKSVAQAKRYFELQRYADALPILNRVIEQVPNDSDAFQFRSFIHFAMGDFEAAAADAYDALSFGNAWDWQTVYDLYGNAETYTAQMRRLETQARAERTLSGHFLLGYHYVVLGHYSRGKNEFQKVLAIQPDEPMAAALVEVLNGLIQESAGK
jgi:hypothetical protein